MSALLEVAGLAKHFPRAARRFGLVSPAMSAPSMASTSS